MLRAASSPWWRVKPRKIHFQAPRTASSKQLTLEEGSVPVINPAMFRAYNFAVKCRACNTTSTVESLLCLVGIPNTEWACSLKD